MIYDSTLSLFSDRLLFVSKWRRISLLFTVSTPIPIHIDGSLRYCLTFTQHRPGNGSKDGFDGVRGIAMRFMRRVIGYGVRVVHQITEKAIFWNKVIEIHRIE